MTVSIPSLDLCLTYLRGGFGAKRSISSAGGNSDTPGMNSGQASLLRSFPYRLISIAGSVYSPRAGESPNRNVSRKGSKKVTRREKDTMGKMTLKTNVQRWPKVHHIGKKQPGEELLHT